MSLDRPTRSIRLLQTDRTVKIVSETNVNPHLRRPKVLNYKFVYDDVNSASFGRKAILKITFWFDSVDSSNHMLHEKFDVWPRP